jgi:hypothetical protein
VSPRDDKLSHCDEYKALRDETTLCQQEMHRTWLWASIAAGAVYTWLYLHWKEVNKDFASNTLLNYLVWLSPPILLFFCAIRYFVFWRRIRHLVLYVLKLEKQAFPYEPLGVAHWCDAAPFWKTVAVIGASIFWVVLIGCSCLFSWELSQKKPVDSSAAPGGALAAPASPPAPIQPAPFPVSTSVTSPPAASSPASSQPTHKP